MSKLTEQINAAPEPLKSYIHDLVSGYGKSAEMVQDNILLKDTVAAMKPQFDQAESQRGDMIRALERDAALASRLADRAWNALDEDELGRQITRKHAFLEVAEKLRRGWPNGS